MHIARVRSELRSPRSPTFVSGLQARFLFAVTVGLLHALFAYQGRVTADGRPTSMPSDRPLPKADVNRTSMAAFGGICDIVRPGDRVFVDIGATSPVRRQIRTSSAVLYGHHPKVDAILGVNGATSPTASTAEPVEDRRRGCARSAGRDVSALGAALNKAGRPDRRWPPACQTLRSMRPQSGQLWPPAASAQGDGRGRGGFL
jgi:hypothetical protein